MMLTTNGKQRQLLSIFFLFLMLFKCSAAQRELPLRPAPYTVDVISSVPIDYDAYNIHLTPASSDAGLRIVVGTDGGGGNGELIAPLRSGQHAPFNGLLFNGPAVARLEVEFRAQESRCLIDRQADVDRITARAITDLRLLQTTLNTQGQSYSLMLRSRDEEIDRLYRHIERNSSPPPFPVLPVVLGSLGALIVGAGVGTVLGAVLVR